MVYGYLGEGMWEGFLYQLGGGRVTCKNKGG